MPSKQAIGAIDTPVTLNYQMSHVCCVLCVVCCVLCVVCCVLCCVLCVVCCVLCVMCCVWETGRDGCAAGCWVGSSFVTTSRLSGPCTYSLVEHIYRSYRGHAEWLSVPPLAAFVQQVRVDRSYHGVVLRCAAIGQILTLMCKI